MWRTGIKLWGFDNGTRVVHSVEELKELFSKKEVMAGYVYVYTWVPILPHAPWFPFAIVATDNKFDNNWVFDRWRIIHRGCAAVCLNLAGYPFPVLMCTRTDLVLANCSCYLVAALPACAASICLTALCVKRTRRACFRWRCSVAQV